MVINKLLIRPFTYLLRGLDSHDNINSFWFLWVFVLIFFETSKSKTDATVMQHPCSSKASLTLKVVNYKYPPLPTPQNKTSRITTLVPLDFPPKSDLYEMPLLENVLTNKNWATFRTLLYIHIAFHCNYSSWLIGILLLAHRNPHKIG